MLLIEIYDWIKWNITAERIWCEFRRIINCRSVQLSCEIDSNYYTLVKYCARNELRSKIAPKTGPLRLCTTIESRTCRTNNMGEGKSQRWKGIPQTQAEYRIKVFGLRRYIGCLYFVSFNCRMQFCIFVVFSHFSPNFAEFSHFLSLSFHFARNTRSPNANSTRNSENLDQLLALKVIAPKYTSFTNAAIPWTNWNSMSQTST